MPAFANTQGISNIQLFKSTRHFCPLGNDWYTAKIDVEFVPGETIMDYCDIDRFFESISGGEQIIEDVVAQVFNHFKTYNPTGLKVVAWVNDATHLAVKVEKRGGRL